MLGASHAGSPWGSFKHRLGMERSLPFSEMYPGIFALSLIAVLDCGNRKDGTKFKSQNRMRKGNEFQALPLSTFSNACTVYTKASSSFLKLLLSLWLYLFCPFCFLVFLVTYLSTLGGKAPHSCTSRIFDKLACELSCAFLQRLQISELKSSHSLVIPDYHQLSCSDSDSFLLKISLDTHSTFSRRPPDSIILFQMGKLHVSDSLTLQRGAFTVRMSPV